MKDKGFSGQGYPITPDHTLTKGQSWLDDRDWIARWIRAGAALAEREPVLRAWIEAAPPQPLPRCLPAIELARIARSHGIVVRVTP